MPALRTASSRCRPASARGLACAVALAAALAAPGALAAGAVPAAQGAAAATSRAPSTNVDWLVAAGDADIDRAFAQARAQSRPLLLYWGATWCPPCNQLKATFFNRQDFAAASRSFVAVHVDGDQRGAQRIGARFKVSGYPTVLLLRADGSEITRLPGEADPERLMGMLQLGMAGGRPAAAVLADFEAGRRLAAGEWRMLAFYSWATDEQQLVAAAGKPELLARLAVAASASGSSADADTQTRLWMAAAAASDDGRGIKADTALRARLLAVLADPLQARRHADIVAGSAAEIVRALSAEETAERRQLLGVYTAALRRMEGDATLSRGDRLGALLARIDLARLDQPADAVKVELPQSLLAEVRAHVARDDREITDGYEREALIPGGAYALGRAGLWAESDALLKSNLARSQSPYALMIQLAGNARRSGRDADALAWHARAFDESRGPATRLQWGASYLGALVELAPQDGARIERVAAQLFDEAAADPGSFAGRSARSLKRVGDRLASWAAGGGRDAVLDRLRRQLDGICPKVDAADGQRDACRKLLAREAAAGAAAGTAARS
ncbi:MAG: thioredoxin family protein [Burkholderiales bacterium]|nr:thioredoxin family protein [Burkholderiales bacterium]